MVNIKNRGKIYAMHKASDKLNDFYGNAMLSVVQFDGYDIQRAYVDGYLQAEQDLEVKEKDLEKEIKLWFDYGLPNNDELLDYIKETAKHFYELGLKAQKGE